MSAGNIKRIYLEEQNKESETHENIVDQLSEKKILIQSVCETLVPKLISEDIPILFSLLKDIFPDVKYQPKQMKK